MTTIYIIIVAFLLLLAVVDLFVGVSNDAVNFLQSSIGARVAKWRTLLILASVGVLVGAMMSAGMMDVARHGILQPENYTFREVMVAFLAVMVTDVIVLDRFNSMGMPTSTTVSLVFELFGAATLLAFIKMSGSDGMAYADLINTDKCLSVIIAIFVSVAIAFACGIIIQWLSRLIFTFQFSKVSSAAVSIFGGISFTILSYFIFIKGLGKSPYVSADLRDWVADNTSLLLLGFFVASTIISFILLICKVSVFKIVVLMGTFALAMAFAGNDLVNFIGVPLAGLDSFNDWQAAGAPDVDTFMMSSLQGSAKSPLIYLFLAGLIMIMALALSKKAMNVVKTSVDLSRQDEGDELFGSSRAARVIVRMVESWPETLGRFVPNSVKTFVAKRFDNTVVEMPEGAAFDVIRASVNLVVASVLIVIGTTFKLPLSTTYVTFMVAMGTSLADKAWGRETAVFRVTGVLSVIGGWFITAGVAFIAAAFVCAIMYYFGFVAQILLMALAGFVVIRSNFFEKDSETEAAKAEIQNGESSATKDSFRAAMAKADAASLAFSSSLFNDVIDGFFDRRVRALRTITTEIGTQRAAFNASRRREMQTFGKLAVEEGRAAADGGTPIAHPFSECGVWLHLGADCRRQYLGSLRRMTEPVLEHVDNGFNPATPEIVAEFSPLRRQVSELFADAQKMIENGTYATDYETIRTLSSEVRKKLKALRHERIAKLQLDDDKKNFKVMMVYVNILRETQNMVNTLRHHIEAAKCFTSPSELNEEEKEIFNNSEY